MSIFAFGVHGFIGLGSEKNIPVSNPTLSPSLHAHDITRGSLTVAKRFAIPLFSKHASEVITKELAVNSGPQIPYFSATWPCVCSSFVSRPQEQREQR